MKIFAASDIHGDIGLVKRLSEKAKGSDVIIIAGDITFAEERLEGLIGPFKKSAEKVLLVPGNHENLATVDFLAEVYSPGVYNMHESGIMIGDVGFFGCGFADIGFFALSEEDAERVLKNAFKAVKGAKKTVLITHSPPYDTKLDELGWTRAGMKSIREFIEKHQPDLCICGHIHETFGFEDMIGKTRIINAGILGKKIEI